MSNQIHTAKILLVDENSDSLEHLNILLEREGYIILTAQDGVNALQLARQTQLDLIIANIILPGMDGIELTKRLRSDKMHGFIPVILVTSNIDSSDKIMALNAGADDFLVKPVERLELIARVRSLLKLKFSSDELLKARKDYAQLFQDAKQQASQLAALSETALSIGGQISLQALLDSIASKSCDMVKSESSMLYLTDTAAQTLTVQAVQNLPDSFLGITLNYGEDLAGRIARQGVPLFQNNYAEWQGRARVFADNQHFCSVLGVPLISSGQVVGVLMVVSNTKNRPFSDGDVRLLNLLAPQASIAIRNALLYQELSHQNYFVNCVLNGVNDGILMLDSDFRVALSNSRFTEMFKLQPEIIAGQTMQDVALMLDEAVESFPPFSEEGMVRSIRQLRRNPQQGFKRKLDIRDPKQRNMEWNSWPVHDQHNAIIGWLNVFQDVTQQTQLEQLREDFIHMLVHDLRNPLTSIIGGVELAYSLEEEGETDPKQHAFLLDTIKKNSYVLLEMINELLELNRLEAGKLPINILPVRLNDLIESSLEQVELPARDRQISLSRKVPALETWINIDHEKMRRVIVNLISNAIKFSPPGSKVTLNVEVEEGVRRRGTTSLLDTSNLRVTTTQFLRDRYGETGPQPKALLLSVSDNGPGIPPEAIERIFDKFNQVKGQRREKQGFGLGLTLCKLVAEAHGGRIWAESTLGSGSTFYVSIPCVIDPANR